MRISFKLALWVVLLVSLALISAVAVNAAVKTPSKNAKIISAVCPVTGDVMPDISKAAAKSVYKGKTYYFCKAACKKKFDASPAKYAKVKKSVPAATSKIAPQDDCKDGVCPLPNFVKSAPAKKISAVCPVMGSVIPDVTKASDKMVYKGKTYYFCCAGCKPLFKANPEKYISKMKKVK